MSVLTIGEVVVDWFSLGEGDNFFESSFTARIGGNATNVAVGLAKLGTNCRLVGKVGHDRSGLYLKQKIEQAGVDASFVKIEPGLNTGHCYVTFAPGFDELKAKGVTIEPGYYEWPRPHAAQLLNVGDITDECFAGIKLMHLTGISLKDEPRCFAVHKAAQMAKEKNILFSFDSSCPVFSQVDKLDRYKELLHLADIIKVNEFELGQWTDSQPTSLREIEIQAKRLMDMYQPSCLVVTMGSDGCLINTEYGISHLPALSMNTSPKHSIGAGDAFMAGFIHALLDGIAKKSTLVLDSYITEASCKLVDKLSLPFWSNCARLGNVTGALATRALGACEAAASLLECEQFLVA